MQPDALGDTIESQFANSPSLLALIQSFNDSVDPYNDIENFYTLIWDLDTNQGTGLDIWGRIVGVGRVLQLPAGIYLGFTEADGQASGDSFDNAPFYSGENTTSNFSLSDSAYRIVILAKAMANITDGSIPSINNIMKYLNNGLADLGLSSYGNCYCTDDGNMSFRYIFSIGTTTLPPLLQAIIAQTGVLPSRPGVATSIVVM